MVLLTLSVQGLSAVDIVALDDIKGRRKEENMEIICISSPIPLSTLILLRRQEATLFSTVVFKSSQENSNCFRIRCAYELNVFHLEIRV